MSPPRAQETPWVHRATTAGVVALCKGVQDAAFGAPSRATRLGLAKDGSSPGGGSLTRPGPQPRLIPAGEACVNILGGLIPGQVRLQGVMERAWARNGPGVFKPWGQLTYSKSQSSCP